MKPAWFALSFAGVMTVAATALFTLHSPLFSGPPEEGDGQELYTRNCAACHGANGKSAMTPDLSNDDFLAITTKENLVAMIEQGRPGRGMPAWSSALKPGEIRAVASYIKKWQVSPDVELPRSRVKGDVEEGRVLFATVCASCHGPDGAGDSAPALNNPGFLKVASDHYVRATLVNGRSGTAMRSFAGPLGLANLTPTELDSVVAYIRSWE